MRLPLWQRPPVRRSGERRKSDAPWVERSLLEEMTCPLFLLPGRRWPLPSRGRRMPKRRPTHGAAASSVVRWASATGWSPRWASWWPRSAPPRSASTTSASARACRAARSTTTSQTATRASWTRSREASGRLLAHVEEAVDAAGPEWEARAVAATSALIGALDADRVLAQLCVVSALGGGDEAVALRRDDAGPDRRAAARARPLPPRRPSWCSRARWAASGIWSTRRLTDEPDGSLADLDEAAAYLMLAPFVGRRQAVARGSGGANAYVTRWTPTVAAGPDEPGLMVTELTGQTLQFLAGHPGAANVDIARAVDVRHESQMSRHLGRLERAGMVRHRTRGPGQRLAADRARQGGGARAARPADRRAASGRSPVCVVEGDVSMNRRIPLTSIAALALAIVPAWFASPAAAADQSWGFEQVTPTNKGEGTVGTVRGFHAVLDAQHVPPCRQAAVRRARRQRRRRCVVRYAATRGDDGWHNRGLDAPMSPKRRLLLRRPRRVAGSLARPRLAPTGH